MSLNQSETGPSLAVLVPHHLPPLAYCQPTVDLGKSSDVSATHQAQIRHPDDIRVQTRMAKAVQAFKEFEKLDFVISRLSQLLRQDAPSKTCHPDLQQEFRRTFMSSHNGSQAIRSPSAPPRGDRVAETASAKAETSFYNIKSLWIRQTRRAQLLDQKRSDMPSSRGMFIARNIQIVLRSLYQRAFYIRSVWNSLKGWGMPSFNSHRQNGRSSKKVVTRKSLVDGEAAMVRPVESMTAVRAFFRMKRDWVVDVAEAGSGRRVIGVFGPGTTRRVVHQSLSMKHDDQAEFE